MNLKLKTWYMSIDTIEVDMGNIGLSGPDDDFLYRFESSFRNCLREKSNLAEALPDELSRKTADQRQWDAIFHFLKNGYFPWWAGEMSVAEIREAVSCDDQGS